MATKSMWASTQSLMVIINYINEMQLRDYRRALDAILDKSHVKKLTIIVNVPKEMIIASVVDVHGPAPSGSGRFQVRVTFAPISPSNAIKLPLTC